MGTYLRGTSPEGAFSEPRVPFLLVWMKMGKEGSNAAHGCRAGLSVATNGGLYKVSDTELCGLWGSTSRGGVVCSMDGAPIFKRQPLAGRRHHSTTNCVKLVPAGAGGLCCALTSVRRSSAELQQPGRCEPGPACAQCPACFLPHARHALLFCRNALLRCMSRMNAYCLAVFC